jgi:hypothetical protein
VREKPDEVRALLEPRLAALRRQQGRCGPANVPIRIRTCTRRRRTQNRY